MNEIAENGGSGGGSSNLVFDLSKAKRPEIDGVEYEYVYIKSQETSDDVALNDVFVYDFQDNYQPIIEINGLQRSGFSYVSDIAHTLIIASQGANRGDLEPYLIEDSDSVIMSLLNGENYIFFPTTAKFGLRKHDDKNK